MGAAMLQHRVFYRVVMTALASMAIAGGAPVSARDATFVAPDRVAAMLLLAAPPAPHSDVAAAELAELHRIEDARTAVQAARAVADASDESIFLYRDVIGEGFNPQALPATGVLSRHVGSDEGASTGPAKKEYARVRPYNADSSLHPVCKTKAVADSYPSGHATAGYLQALTLIELMPARRDAILARANEYAGNRLVCGVHYRSDIEAGKLLAYAIHATMREHPAYRKEVADARAELERVLGTAVVAP